MRSQKNSFEYVISTFLETYPKQFPTNICILHLVILNSLMFVVHTNAPLKSNVMKLQLAE